MYSPTSPIPSIEISLAPPEEIPEEPYSPFSSLSTSFVDDPDSPRSALLLPPPVISPNQRERPLNPSLLGPSPRGLPRTGGKGLDKERFESLLRATRERNATPGKRAVDLRKEVALKAHKSKQAERRAIFLSKIDAPPSPSAISMPVTPPDSPAILHYSYPSPGLESPISMFESLSGVVNRLGDDKHRPSWIEHVDFQAPDWEHKMARKAAILSLRTPKSALPSKKQALPSLDQISARIKSQQSLQQQCQADKSSLEADQDIASVPVKAPAPRAPIPLPAFLRSRAVPTAKAAVAPNSPAAPARLPLPILPIHRQTRPTPPPPPHPKFGVTTTILAPTPRSLDDATTPLTAANLTILDNRTEMGKAMLEKILRRVSSPAELERAGHRHGEVFGEHRVLKIPGGF